MNFTNEFNNYLNKHNITITLLSKESGLSKTVLSRYKNGHRTPKNSSEELNKLCSGLSNIIGINKDKIYNNLNNLIIDNFDYETFSKNFNNIINILKINVNELSKYTNYDNSHISRIRHNKSKISSPNEFVKKVSEYIYYKHNNEILSTIISNITIDSIYKYLTSNNINDSKTITNFLNNLDSFNLNDYINNININDIKIPTSIISIPKSKKYFTPEEIKQSEIDFFKITALSSKTKNIFMYNTMPFIKSAQDENYHKRWMMMASICLKKGFNIKIIHNLDRPLDELLIGLENWMGLYMTGLVSPYYIKEKNNYIFNHLLYLSESAALTGECVKNHFDNSMYYLTNNQNELNYYNKKKEYILEKSIPLMNIYKNNNKNYQNEFILDNTKRILFTLPLFTISDNTLIDILNKNNISTNDINKIIEYKNKEYNYYKNLINNYTLNDNIYIQNKNNFNNKDNYLLLSNIFYNKKIYYDYDNYIKHLNETYTFSKNNNNYIINTFNNKIFNNITIDIISNKKVLIHKHNNNIIHFSINHPILIDSINKINPQI